MDCVEPIKAKMGKFRGVEFHLTSGSHSGGRRIAVHEYPYRDGPYTEDMGRSSRRFSVSGYITQPDVRDKARRLQNAFEQFGAGPLYEPWLNKTIIARCEGYSIDTSRGELTTVPFSATFVEKGEDAAPTILRNALSQLFGVLDTFNEALSSGYNLVLGAVDDAGALVDGFGAARGYFDFQARRAGGGTAHVAAAAGGPINGFVADVSAAAGSSAREIDFLAEMSAIRTNAGAAASVSALAYGGAALSRYAAIVIGADYSTRGDGYAAVRRFVTAARQYQGLAESLGQFGLAKEAQTLAALAGGRVANEFADLPIMREYSRSGNALVLSYEVYGVIDRASDLMDWNGAVTADLVGPIMFAAVE
jgi:DNA circularisation protein N-terminus